jgi:hypothetical protein
MISDPKSAHFIAWTELGTSFVVSNVGEFSRSILGSHFKHNNVSICNSPRGPLTPPLPSSPALYVSSTCTASTKLIAYVPHTHLPHPSHFFSHHQTPRAQRTSTDAQTWEFSHHKFLRGRPDLLDEIKRKALEPDPTVKHRVELPGEVNLLITFAFILLP